MPINYGHYPKNWKTEIRPAILERDGHKCKTCGVPNYAVIERLKDGTWKLWPEGMQGEAHTLDGHKGVKVILTIAHLDNDITNNDYSNLAALCQFHHLMLDLPQHKANARATREKKMLLQKLF